jgi:uncharacterized protein YjlB
VLENEKADREERDAMIGLSANDDQELGGERQFLVEIESYLVPDDGCIPNNGKLPLLIYREAIAPRSLGEQPAGTLEALFKGNGWGAAWVDGIYDYHHYHSTAHEVLGLARGWAKVQFGGPQGLIAELTAGDVIAIPAGVGHCRLAEDDLVVVGAYPQGEDWNVCRPTMEDREKALENIPWVPLPKLDPVFGEGGALTQCWID